MNLLRYDYLPGDGLVIADDGYWVRYEDHAAVHAALVAQLEAATEALAAAERKAESWERGHDYAWELKVAAEARVRSLESAARDMVACVQTDPLDVDDVEAAAEALESALGGGGSAAKLWDVGSGVEVTSMTDNSNGESKSSVSAGKRALQDARRVLEDVRSGKDLAAENRRNAADALAAHDRVKELEEALAERQKLIDWHTKEDAFLRARVRELEQRTWTQDDFILELQRTTATAETESATLAASLRAALRDWEGSEARAAQWQADAESYRADATVAQDRLAALQKRVANALEWLAVSDWTPQDNIRKAQEALRG